MFEPKPRRQEIEQAGESIVVYGTRWCADTQKARRYLDRMGIPYLFRDMEGDPQADAQVRWWTGGYSSHPTIQIGGTILIEPDLEELQTALVEHEII